MSISILTSGGSVPFQAEGYLNNDLAFYYRDRHGRASLAVSPVKHKNPDGTPLNWFDDRHLNDNIPSSFSAYWIATADTEEFMGCDTFPTVMSQLLTQLSRNPYSITFNPDGDHEFHTSGFSPEEAWNATEWADQPMPDYILFGGAREYPEIDPVFPQFTPEEIREASDNPTELTEAETEQYRDALSKRVKYLTRNLTEKSSNADD